MKPNMGTVDRTIRGVVVLIIAALFFFGQVSGVAAVILGVIAVAFLVTSMIGWCPLYVPLGFSTRKGNEPPPGG